MRRFHLVVAFLFGLLLPSLASAKGSPRIVPPEILATISDDDPVPLPRSPAPFELALPLPDPSGLPLAPPAGVVDTPAEYEGNRGMWIRWGSFNAELTAMTVPATTASPPSEVFIVVSGASQQASAESTLSGAGADLSQIEFLTAPSDSVWIRDYGPRFIDDAGELAIVDHVYNRPRPNDDDIPLAIAADWSLSVYDLPLVHGGGNFHLFDDGEAFASELIVNENPGLTAQDIVDYFAAYEGLDLTIWQAFPASFDATQHIDMWMLPVRRREAIVGSYDVATGIPHQVTESMVTELLGRGYTVHRTPGWRAGGTHYTYTNAVILDGVVFLPEYDGYGAENQAAVVTFEAAFPNRAVVAIDASFLVTFAGVFHCIVMHVPRLGLFADGFESGDAGSWTATVP